MQYFNDNKKEKDNISIAETGKLFYKNTHLYYDKYPADFNKFIMKRTNKDTVILENDCRVIIGERAIDSLYRNYSDIRIRKIDNYLHTKSDSTNIKIKPLHKGMPKNTNSKPVFEMKYSIEE